MTNRDYTMKVEKQIYEDGSFEWVASFLEIKGIIGVGDTQIEAVTEAEEAKKAFLYALEASNSPIPEANCDVSFSGRTTVRMSKRLHKLVFECAQDEGISLNQLIVDAVNVYVTESITKRKMIFDFSMDTILKTIKEDCSNDADLSTKLAYDN